MSTPLLIPQTAPLAGGRRAARTGTGTGSGADPLAPAAATATAGTWTATASLPFAGFWAQPDGAAVLLADGKVLIAGGEDGGRRPFADAALFEPAGGTWTRTGSLWSARRLHTSTRLADGRVLVTGGIGTAPSLPAQGLASAEVYDPATGQWTRTGDLRLARYSHSATLLADGRVLVAGGSGARSAQSNGTLRSAEVYDPATGEWTETAPLTDARFGHPAVRLNDGRVLVVGGVLTIGRGRYTALGYCEAYDPATAAWTPTASLGVARKSHQATLLADDSVLVTGGDLPGLGTETLTYDPYSQWTTERFDPAKDTWSADAEMSWGRSHHRTLRLTSGTLLRAGGTDGASFDIGYQNASTYDPVARTWSADFGTVVGRWAPAAVALADGRALMFGGITLSGVAAPVAGESVVTATAEIFTPGTTAAGTTAAVVTAVAESGAVSTGAGAAADAGAAASGAVAPAPGTPAMTNPMPSNRL